jgi:hypothetical protein
MVNVWHYKSKLFGPGSKPQQKICCPPAWWRAGLDDDVIILQKCLKLEKRTRQELDASLGDNL